VEAIVKRYRLSSHDNPPFRNYFALKERLPASCNSMARECLPCLALVRAYCVRLPSSTDPDPATFERILPFLQGCFMGLARAPSSVDGLRLLSMPKISSHQPSRDTMSATMRNVHDVRVCLLFLLLFFVGL
jgi:hypothetical protein